MAIYSAHFVSALPVVPGTDRPYTQRQWRDELVALSDAFARHRPRLTYAGNAVGNTYRYWDNPVSSRRVVRNLPAAAMEDFMRGAGDRVSRFPTGARWRKNLDAVRDIESHGGTGLFLTKLWVAATPAQLRTWQAYAMATFLLGADGHSYFAFTDARTKAAVLGSDLPYRMPRHLGRPTSDVHHAHGVYRRHFAHGLVVVNPTRHRHRVGLGHSYVTLGGRHVHRLRLRPHHAQVLVVR